MAFGATAQTARLDGRGRPAAHLFPGLPKNDDVDQHSVQHFSFHSRSATVASYCAPTVPTQMPDERDPVECAFELGSLGSNRSRQSFGVEPITIQKPDDTTSLPSPQHTLSFHFFRRCPSFALNGLTPATNVQNYLGEGTTSEIPSLETAEPRFGTVQNVQRPHSFSLTWPPMRTHVTV